LLAIYAYLYLRKKMSIFVAVGDFFFLYANAPPRTSVPRQSVQTWLARLWTGPHAYSPHRHTQFLQKNKKITKESGILSSSFASALPHHPPFGRVCTSSTGARVRTSAVTVRICTSVECRL
jgi:hypothetical protein